MNFGLTCTFFPTRVICATTEDRDATPIIARLSWRRKPLSAAWHAGLCFFKARAYLENGSLGDAGWTAETHLAGLGIPDGGEEGSGFLDEGEELLRSQVRGQKKTEVAG